MHVHALILYVHTFVGDEQPSSEDVLSESADEIPVADSEAAHVHVADVDSPTHESHEQLCTEVEDVQQDSSNKGVCTQYLVVLSHSECASYRYMYKVLPYLEIQPPLKCCHMVRGRQLHTYIIHAYK